jgi:hypothetical protein
MALSERERTWIEIHFEDLRKEVVQARIDIATLKVKAGFWGVIGGCIPVLIGFLIYLVPRIPSGGAR